jgi:CPA1 family monovalent cation:H+ antiporter
MSPRAVRAHLGQITLVAIGLVIVTTLVGALVAPLAVNRMPWAAVFVLGAILSPPDPGGMRAFAERLHVLIRIRTMLEGERLFKHAAALAIYPAAVAASVTGQFPVQHVFLTCMGGVTGGIITRAGQLGLLPESSPCANAPEPPPPVI